MRGPLGQTAELSREKASLKIFKLSDMVPTVERTPGTWGRWRSANADGKYCTESTLALPT